MAETDVDEETHHSFGHSSTSSVSTDDESRLHPMVGMYDTGDWHKYREELEYNENYEHCHDEVDAENLLRRIEEEQERYKEFVADWSQTKRGSHIDFASTEEVPLKEDVFLGRGAMGDVYQTEVMGFKLAWKRVPLRRQVTQKDLREMEILKKLSHAHIVSLIGTYTHRQCFGLLLEPVAVCDLHTLFEDIEAHWDSRASPSQEQRLHSLCFFGRDTAKHKATPIYFQIGCLVSAVTYLHEQKIRHKDLKPSNILMAEYGLYLSDFGTATDFSLLSQSATDNERGTPKYFAPEVAEWEPNGRAADIFSLGCILLEILILDQEGTLDRLRAARSTKNTAYHANLDKLNEWLPLREDVSPIDYHLIREIRAMLSHNPRRRPSAAVLLQQLKYSDKLHNDKVDYAAGKSGSIFGSCCRLSLVHKSEFDDMQAKHKKEIGESRHDVWYKEQDIRVLKIKLDEAENDKKEEIKKLEDKHNITNQERKNVLEKESASLKDEVNRLTTELAESRRLFEQASTALAHVGTRDINNTSIENAEANNVINSHTAIGADAAGIQNLESSEKRIIEPDTSPKALSPAAHTHTKQGKSSSTGSPISNPAKPGDESRASDFTSNGASRPDQQSSEASSKQLGESTGGTATSSASGDDESRTIVSRGRWPRLAKMVGYKKVQFLDEHGRLESELETVAGKCIGSAEFKYWGS
ncbi:hypothetical protein E8E13_010133 [Curvularia kusanoi]|uniref:non-specific serine/threonine protein kinase n=1 Tax=Curvularia kusanoi TaxID=90978 RepID=A0A9P4TFA8_CURKU|nr:hypothetical protein E8E13_010133 [Curvularia kusanoi]